MRSYSELLTYMFPPETRMGLLMQSDFPNFDGIKYYLRFGSPKSSDFGPKSHDTVHRILKSKSVIGL